MAPVDVMVIDKVERPSKNPTSSRGRRDEIARMGSVLKLRCWIDREVLGAHRLGAA